MKRILVTGANGYIGKNVVHWLVENGYEVLAIDISTDRVDNRAEKIEMNIFEEYKKLLPRLNGIDSCIHLAWRNGFVHNSITHLQDIWGGGGEVELLRLA